MNKALTALCILCVVGQANAATLTLTIDFSGSPSAGGFEIRARLDSPSDAAGLASYGFAIKPGPGFTITALDHKSARANVAENYDGSLTGSVGFTTMRSPDGVANVVIRGGQNLTTPTPFLIYGFGQTAGSFQSVANGPVVPLGSNEGNNWASNPVIASGTYSGPVNATWEGAAPVVFDSSTPSQFGAEVFASGNSSAVTPLRFVRAYASQLIPLPLPPPTAYAEFEPVPEPASFELALIGVGIFFAAVLPRGCCDRRP
jgi:hypothetical protein